MKDYKQKYEELYERISNLVRDYDCVSGLIDVREELKSILNESQESEDEKIRKEIIQSIQDNMCVIHKDKCIAWLEKQGEQKPTDKVKPKFKIGDWIVYCNEDVDLITGIEEEGYRINEGGYIPFVCEDDMRIWTIKDAKDGDVLNSTRVKATIIFKGFNHDCKHIDAYCALQSGIFIHQEMLWDRDFDPAPKVWKNNFFAAMKESGYEWDAEKKELKKIEQKPAWSGEDKAMLEEILYFINEYQHSNRCRDESDMQNSVTCENWLRTLPERMKGE